MTAADLDTEPDLDATRYYRPSAVCRFYGVSASSLSKQCVEGKVRAKRTPGHHWRILGAVVIDDWKQARNYRPAKAASAATRLRKAQRDQKELSEVLGRSLPMVAAGLA